MTMTAADSPVRVGGEDGVRPRGERPRRRVFSAEYKVGVVAQYDAAADGEKGALLRREGLYSSHVTEWRKARDAGMLSGVGSSAPKRRGKRSAEQVEIDRLRARAEKAEAELARTQAALEIVGKAHALLELLSESADAENKPKR